jgi:tellurite resistance protein
MDETLLLQFYEKLEDVAKSDGKITDEERSLLEASLEHLTKLEAKIMKAFSDRVVTRSEKEELNNLLENFDKETYDLAKLDGKISNDEMSILLQISDIIVRLKALYK